jgi:hypothetical protein
MEIVRSRTGWLSGLLAAVVIGGSAPAVTAQTTMMGSTLRYGSGYLDVPSASVLPHLALLGTFSGFWVNTDQSFLVNETGQTTGFGPGVDDFKADGSVTLGLYDRVEVGATFQSFNDADMGGNMVGAFGRLALLRPEAEGIGLAVGARYVSAPEYDGSTREFQPTRLGIPDDRFHKGLPDGGDVEDEVITELSLYGVASAFVRGMDISWLPQHDWTFSAGWGTGLFRDGEELPFYSFADSEGFFGGGSVNFALSESSVLRVLGEWNGFDLNWGAQFDFGGFRIGGHWLGANYQSDLGTYRSDKWGVLGSVALCLQGEDGFLCKPGMLPREASDTVRLPAPPPDTVMVEREVAPPLPTGTPTDICLATGENAQVLVTAQGDTLVGPGRVSIGTLRPGIVFAGSYAEGLDWFESDEAITFENANYQKSGGEVRLDCADIMQVGEHMGVPLFAQSNAQRPFETLYVPVRPGVWQAYQTGLQQTRG